MIREPPMIGTVGGPVNAGPPCLTVGGGGCYGFAVVVADLGGRNMDLDDLEPRNKKPEPRNLDVMSIKALEECIAELEGEIARVRQAIAAKKDARAGADSVFKT
jgi:uncharacterized small protein (DUF1192 family)